jgi:hypothetical protein
MKYVVHTQTLENYGAHCEDGKFSSGNAYWKFKGGDTYVVDGLERIQDAVAFVAAICLENSLGYKEFPRHHTSYEVWLDELNLDDDEYREFRLKDAKYVDPRTYGKVEE